MDKIDPAQLQNHLDMISKDSDKILISKDSDNMPIIALPLSKIENTVRAFESVTKELAAEREKTRNLEARLNVLDNAHTPSSKKHISGKKSNKTVPTKKSGGKKGHGDKKKAKT